MIVFLIITVTIVIVIAVFVAIVHEGGDYRVSLSGEGVVGGFGLGRSSGRKSQLQMVVGLVDGRGGRLFKTS